MVARFAMVAIPDSDAPLWGHSKPPGPKAPVPLADIWRFLKIATQSDDHHGDLSNPSVTPNDS